MLAIFVAAYMAAAAPSPLEVARDKQDRAALTEFAAQAGAAAAKAPNDAEAQYRAALANCYLAEVTIELHDRKGGRQIAEQGIRFAEKTVSLGQFAALFANVNSFISLLLMGIIGSHADITSGWRSHQAKLGTSSGRFRYCCTSRNRYDGSMLGFEPTHRH